MWYITRYEEHLILGWVGVSGRGLLYLHPQSMQNNSFLAVFYGLGPLFYLPWGLR